MPVTVVVGGQFGSEGKGKVSAVVAQRSDVAAVVRVGGPNSGHTAVDSSDTTWMFRQLPAAAATSECDVFIPAGSLIDVDLLLSEIRQLGIGSSRLRIDANASIVTPTHKKREAAAEIAAMIGSTVSGTGASLIERIERTNNHQRAADIPELSEYIVDNAANAMRKLLNNRERILIEGTQGFGLSIWHTPYYPFATSRDTTAASFVGEAGLAPHDVDDVILVLRSFPIRVGGNSGPLPNEIGWQDLAAEAKLPSDFHETTSATHRIRRVARFDAQIVKAAIASNCPHHIVLNHMDYVDPDALVNGPGEMSRRFIDATENAIGHVIDYIGYSASDLRARDDVFRRLRA